MANQGFDNNPNLPRADYKHIFTQHELDEFTKCESDPVYFTENYIKIVNVDRGLITFPMWDFQKNMMRTFADNRFSICLCPRQVGKTSVSVAYLLHHLMFNPDVYVAILANKSAMAREIMSRLQLAFEFLPTFLKQGVVEWNKGNIEFANGSKALAESTSGTSVRGRSFNIIFLDEFAHVPQHVAEAFFASTYPTISSGTSTKVIIVSTPLGLNLFWKLWNDASEKRSDYIPFSVHWSQVPGRDEKWKQETIRNTSERQFSQEFECEFLGSTNTLISPAKIRSMSFGKVLRHEAGLDVYEDPIPNHTYTLCVDVSEGQGLDYSAFSVIDITQIPYKQVAKYRDNTVTPMTYPSVIYSVGKRYNDAFVLVEINSIGLQVADILHFELAYENLIKVSMKGRQGQQYTGGFNKTRIAFGLKISAQTKKIGCANLKTLIESDKLIVQDPDTIMEFTTFSADKNSFKAEGSNNDDLVMGLVHFGWLFSQKFFKDGLGDDIRKALVKEQLSVQEEEAPLPFGVIDSMFHNQTSRNKKIYRDATDVWVDITESYNWRGKPDGFY